MPVVHNYVQRTRFAVQNAEQVQKTPDNLGSKGNCHFPDEKASLCCYDTSYKFPENLASVYRR